MSLLLAALLALPALPAYCAQGPSRAFDIAAEGLAGDIAVAGDGAARREYVMAGAHQYYWIWARDFSWSVPGLLDIGRAQAVRDTLELAFDLQRDDGLLPRDILPDDYRVRYILGYLGMRRPFQPPFQPTFVSENGVVTVDSNIILVWAASEYVLAEKDRAFAEQRLAAAEKAVDFIEKNYFADGLVARQPPFADWEDSVARTGSVAYTDELYVLALRGLADWAGQLGRKEERARYAERARRAQERFNQAFWIPERGVIRNFLGDDHLTLDANLMAVAYGLVSPERASRIMAALRSSPLWKPLPGRATTPDYPSSMKSFLPRFSGNGHYHDGQHWLWLTALAALAESRSGNRNACKAILGAASAVVSRDGGACENYVDSADGSTIVPMRSWLYRSECPLSWSAAMFVHAVRRDCRP